MSVIDEDEKLVDHRRKDVTTEIYKKDLISKKIMEMLINLW